MTWKSFHRRGEILRDVIAAADRRRDGVLPLDVAGVAETFGDELSLLGALQLRWHTRLSGHLERALMQQPTEPEDAVLTAWHATADELPGVLAILDRHRAEPRDPAMAAAMAKAAAKERILMAATAGRVGAGDRSALRVGAEIERRARETYQPRPAAPRRVEQLRLRDRIKAAVAA
jgi:hypothetical protein